MAAMRRVTSLLGKFAQVFSSAGRDKGKKKNRISPDLEGGEERIEAASPSRVLQDALDQHMAQSRNQEMWEAAQVALGKNPQSTKEIEDFFNELRDMPDDMEVVEFLLRVLERIKASDMALIPSLAAVELTRRRRIEILARLERIRSHLPPIGIFYQDYRNWYVDVAIAVLKNARAGERCNCKAYAKCRASPHWEDMDITRTEDRQNGRYTDISATCKVCQQRWKIVEDSHYHYSFFEWRKEETTFRGTKSSR